MIPNALFPSTPSARKALSLFCSTLLLSGFALLPSARAQQVPIDEELLVDSGVAESDAYGLLHGFYLDPDTAKWVIAKPIGYLLAPLPDTHPVGQGYVEFMQRWDSETLRKHESSGVGLDITTPTVTVALKAGQSHDSGRTSSRSEFILAYAQDYGGSNITSSTQFQLTPLATQILALPEPDRSIAWKANFGTHVAVGIAYRMHVGLKFALNESSDYDVRSRFLDLAASYEAATTQDKIGELLFKAHRAGVVDLSIEHFGDKKMNFTIPSVESIQTPSAQSQWVSSLISSVGDSKRRFGLYLRPAKHMFGLTQVDLPPFDEAKFGLLNGTARRALELIRVANSFSVPADYRLFLSQHAPAGSSDSFDTQIQAAKDELGVQLGNLWQAYKRYLRDGGTLRGVELDTVRHAVDAANDALEGVELGVQALAASLPQPSAQLEEYHGLGSEPGQGHFALFVLTLDNLGVFFGSEPEVLRRWLSACSPDGSSHNPIRITQYDHGTWSDRTTCDYWPTVDRHGIEGISVDEVSTIPSGPGAGLKHVVLRMRVDLNQAATLATVRVTDMLRNDAYTGEVDIAGPGSSYP